MEKRNSKGQFAKGHSQIGGFVKGHKIRNTGRTCFKKGRIPFNKKEIKKKCKNCGKEFLTIKGKFCSQKCYWEYMKGKKKPDYPNNRKKRKKNPMTGKKISKSLKKRFEDPTKHPNWQGGISLEPYGLEFNDNLKEVIRNRDRRKCQISGKTELELGYKLSVHHIDYDKKNNDPKNLVSLSRSSHAKTNYNRKYWTKHFKEKLWQH